jgi:putative endonuclease
MKYYTYILKCKDKTFYTGSTNNLEKRLNAHNKLKSGARYTKIRRPVKLVYVETLKSLAAAMAREAKIKRLNRKEKIALIKNYKKIV